MYVNMSNVFINIWLACLRAIFTFLHLVCNALQYFDTTWTLFKRKIEIYSLGAVDTELYVSRFVTSLECPSHLAVIVGNEAVACEDFTNLVIWCLAAGISILTVFDHKGFILEQEMKFHRHFVENSRIKGHGVTFKNLQVKSGGNGYNNKLQVHILSGSDSKAIFVDLVQQMGKKNVFSEYFDSAIDQQIITEHLLRKTSRPEPQLAIVVSPHMSTYGFPPWDIRLTELVRINSLSGMNVREFCRVLHRYSQCEKRLGK